jgi:hypothetical protein
MKLCDLWEWVELGLITFSEISPAQKAKYHIFTHMQ